MNKEHCRYFLLALGLVLSRWKQRFIIVAGHGAFFYGEGTMQQKVEDEQGTPIVTDDSHIVSAWVVVGCMVLCGVLLVGVWLFKN